MAIRRIGNGAHVPPSGNGSGRRSSNGGNGSNGDLARQIRAIAVELREFRAEQARRWEEQKDINISVRDTLHDISRELVSLHVSLQKMDRRMSAVEERMRAGDRRQDKINRLLVRELQALRRSRN